MWVGLNVARVNGGGLNAERAQCWESSMWVRLNAGRD